jgi:ATP-binding cassette, subfamily B, bacterial PglK
MGYGVNQFQLAANPMEESVTISQAIKELYRQLPLKRRHQFRWILALLVLGGLAELATIGAVLPFLAVIAPGASEGRAAGAVAIVAAAGEQLGLSTLAVATGGLILVAVASAALRLVLTWVSYKFVFATAHDLGVRLYERMLHQPYAYHVMRNTSHTVSGLEKVQHVLAYVLVPMMLSFTSAGVAVFVIAALVALEPMIAIGASILFIIIYTCVSFVTKRRLTSNSAVIADALRARVQTVQEGLGGIRDVILDRSQPIFLAKFGAIEGKFRRAQAVNYFVTASPRFVVEASTIVMIALLAFYITSQPGGIVAALPMLGAMAVGAQRLLPLGQQVYASWSQISGSRAVVADVVDLMRTPMPEDNEKPAPVISFTKAIELQNVSYRYPSGDTPILRGISLTIPKGIRIGIVGKSGSGKSTLVDLLMGLLDPTDGELRVDDRRIDADAKRGWQRLVAHVPQAIYLSDSSISSNIAFGRKESEIDMVQVRQAAREADLDAFISTLPDGYETEVGERGIRLSGGQRQRLGIARALYKRATVLVLDEATSALDDETETSVMESIARLSEEITVIMIAHRISTLRSCARIVEMVDGRIAAIGSYQEIVGRAAA